MQHSPSPEADLRARGVHRSRVEWLDTDASGHHHNTAIARYMEAAEAELMPGRGPAAWLEALR